MADRDRKSRSRNYEVGRGRPPVKTRFKPGQSGNPKGRPKGSKNLLTYFSNALDKRLEIQENGRHKLITVREGIVRRVINEALKGNLKATAFVLAKEPEIVHHNREVPKITSNMSAQEAAALWEASLKENKPPSSKY